MSEDLWLKGLDQYVSNALNDGTGGAPVVRQYLGTWAATEAADPLLSQVILQSGTWVRNVPKLSHVTGLTAGKTVLLEQFPGVPLHIKGILVGAIKTAAVGSTDTDPPTVPTSLAAGTATTTTQPLTWTASTDNVAVAAYDVYVNGQYRMSVVTNAATVTGLTENTSYDYKVRARDSAGNISGFSSEISASTAVDSGPPPGTVYTRQYAATWSGTYGYNGGNEYDSWYGTEAHQGQYDGGNKKSLIGGFNTSTNGTSMASDLSGATAIAARIRLTYFHWWSNAGGTAVVGTHGHTTLPGTFSAATNLWQSAGVQKGVARWVDLGAGVCAGFIAGTHKGIALGPGPSGSSAYYGKAYGAGSGVYVPLLELTFEK